MRITCTHTHTVDRDNETFKCLSQENSREDRLQTENGKRRMKNGEWRMENCDSYANSALLAVT